MLAVCGDDTLQSGKSGNFFYLTQDEQFMIKTVKKLIVKVNTSMYVSYVLV